MKKKIPPLHVEHFQDHTNATFLSLIEFKRTTFLGIVNNLSSVELEAYVLDYAHRESIELVEFLSVCNRWYYGSSHLYPLSVELSKLGLSRRFQGMFRSFDINYVSRVVGLPFSFGHLDKSKVKRKRVIPVPDTIEIRLKSHGTSPDHG